MSSKYSKFLTGLFCLFIGGMLLVSTILPDREMSETENRYLQQAPTLSRGNITHGTFMSQAEDYTADQIVGRDFWVALNAWCERMSGKQENNGVYFGKEDTLLNRVSEPSWEDTPARGDTPFQAGLSTRLDYVDALVGNVSVPVYFGLIPSSSTVWTDRLPAGAPTAAARRSRSTAPPGRAPDPGRGAESGTSASVRRSVPTRRSRWWGSRTAAPARTGGTWAAPGRSRCGR